MAAAANTFWTATLTPALISIAHITAGWSADCRLTNTSETCGLALDFVGHQCATSRRVTAKQTSKELVWSAGFLILVENPLVSTSATLSANSGNQVLRKDAMDIASVVEALK